jgi:hypothetical protein
MATRDISLWSYIDSPSIYAKRLSVIRNGLAREAVDDGSAIVGE